MTIYIDSDYKCYTTPADDRRSIETDAFNGKCKLYIEGYRFVPAGERLILPDGSLFRGEMIAPFRDYEILEELQSLYEEMLAEQQDMKTALNELGVTVDG